MTGEENEWRQLRDALAPLLVRIEQKKASSDTASTGTTSRTGQTAQSR
jgi:hypothetical protein